MGCVCILEFNFPANANGGYRFIMLPQTGYDGIHEHQLHVTNSNCIHEIPKSK